MALACLSTSLPPHGEVREEKKKRQRGDRGSRGSGAGTRIPGASRLERARVTLGPPRSSLLPFCVLRSFHWLTHAPVTPGPLPRPRARNAVSSETRSPPAAAPDSREGVWGLERRWRPLRASGETRKEGKIEKGRRLGAERARGRVRRTATGHPYGLQHLGGRRQRVPATAPAAETGISD